MSVHLSYSEMYVRHRKRQHLAALLHQRTLEKTNSDNDRNSLIIDHPQATRREEVEKLRFRAK